MKEHSTFIGMDVHKNSIDIAIADQGRKGQVRHYGKIDGTLLALDKVVRKLVSKGSRLHFVYEAGPCGYQIYRHLTAKGLDCAVVAPSRIPKTSGNQIKNDRRDAMMLARLHRSGELTAVYVPRAEDEAVRDLTRAREDAKSDEKSSKQRLLSFLLRHGIRYTGGSPWSKAHMRWLSDIKMPHRSQQVVLQEYIGTVNQCKERVFRLTEQIQQLLTEWQLYPVVQALQSMRGVSTIVAAWAYRLPARVSRALLKRQEDLPESVCDIAWKAQLRLCSRYRHLWNKGKVKQVIVRAIARELCGFMWAIANEIEAPANA